MFQDSKGRQNILQNPKLYFVKKHDYNVLDAIVLALNKQPYFAMAP
jgi:hypothetical protein